MDNLFGQLPSSLPQELTDVLIDSHRVRIQRIVSTGHRSPDGFWYDQEEDEWVAVLRGEAELSFDDDDPAIHLRAGDHIHIPAHRRHRVEWTSADEPTVWLAVFYRE